MKKIITFLLTILFFLTGCEYISIGFDSSINSNPLKLLSFEIYNQESKELNRKEKKKDDDKFFVNISSEDNIINIEAVVENEKRLSFVDMVLYVSFLDTYVVYNEGNGDYVCATETEKRDNTWVTNIYVNINIDTKLYHEGFVEVSEITFLDLGSKKIKTDITTVESKQISYHCHYGYTIIENVIATCINEGYTLYLCDNCTDEFKLNKSEIDPNNHKGNHYACKYCGYKEINYKYKDGNEIIEDITFNTLENVYYLDTLLNQYDNVVLFFMSFNDNGHLISKINNMYNYDKEKNFFLGIYYNLSLINQYKDQIDFPLICDEKEVIRNMFEFSSYYGDAVVINRSKKISVITLSFYEDIKAGLIELAKKCDVDIIKILHTPSIETIKAKYYVDDNTIMEININNELIFYKIKGDDLIQEGDIYYYREYNKNKLWFIDINNNKISLDYYKGTDSLIIEGEDTIYAYEYYSYNFKKACLDNGLSIEEILVTDENYYIIEREDNIVRAYYVYKDNKSSFSIVGQYKNIECLINMLGSVELYNVITYGYGTLIHLMGMEETWEIVDKVIQSLPKEQLPIDTQKYLEVCPLEEGTSSLDYLISYMSYKGYSIMSKENGYFYCFEQDFESLSNQLLETFSSIQVEDTQGNIIKELECIDCYVFYKEDAYAVVLITEDNNECFYDVIGNVYFIKYGYFDVMGDIYGALETWKVNI